MPKLAEILTRAVAMMVVSSVESSRPKQSLWNRRRDQSIQARLERRYCSFGQTYEKTMIFSCHPEIVGEKLVEIL